MDALLHNSCAKEVKWVRRDPDAMTLADYVSEQSMVKVWYAPPNASPNDGLPELRSIELLSMVFNAYPSLQPAIKQRIDAKMEPEPHGYKLVRDLLLDYFTAVPIKQQKSNPRNLIIALKPKRPKGKTQCLNEGATASKFDQVIHIACTLDEKFEQVTSAAVLR